MEFGILVALAALAGPALHLAIFIRGEWHLEVPRILAFHAIAYCMLWLLVPAAPSNHLQHFLDTSFVFGTYVFTILASIGTYRIFFHPLRKFPGPRLAALTKFWHVWQQRDGKNHRVLTSLRHQYGEFVRTGPNEITAFHPAASVMLDTAKYNVSRSDWYDVLPNRSSIIFTRSESEHEAQRRTWTAGLSTKSIEIYYPRIKRHITRLMSLIDRNDSKPVLLNDIMAWFSFDSMGDFLFNENLGMMDSSKYHEAILQQMRALAFLAPFNDIIWVACMALKMFPFINRVRDFNGMMKFCDEAMKRRMAVDPPEIDISTWFIQEYNDLKATRTLQERESLLSGNVVTAVVGGSDTIRPTLIDTFYLLAKYPEHARKIYEEVRDLDLQKEHMSVLASKPHLNAVIDESMRLLPASMTGPSGAGRLTGEQGLLIDETFIPPGTKVAAPKWCNMRLETAFEKPDDFIPERWTTRPELVKDPRAFAPFGSGFRQCVGKPLALTIMRLVFATVIQRYEIVFAPGQDVDELERDMRDCVTQQPGPCRVLFKKREVLLV